MNTNIRLATLALLLVCAGCINSVNINQNTDPEPNFVALEHSIAHDTMARCDEFDFKQIDYFSNRIVAARNTEFIFLMNDIGDNIDFVGLGLSPVERLKLCLRIGYDMDTFANMQLNPTDGAKPPSDTLERITKLNEEYAKIARTMARSKWWGKACDCVNVKGAAGGIQIYRDICNYTVWGSIFFSRFSSTLWDLRKSCIGQVLSVETREAVATLEEIGWVLTVYPYLKGEPAKAKARNFLSAKRQELEILQDKLVDDSRKTGNSRLVDGARKLVDDMRSKLDAAMPEECR